MAKTELRLRIEFTNQHVINLQPVLDWSISDNGVLAVWMEGGRVMYPLHNIASILETEEDPAEDPDDDPGAIGYEPVDVDGG